MRFSTVAAAAALASGAIAYTPAGNSTGPVYETKVVTAITTYCPTPTQITHGGKTYTITKATTLTITDCPCTVTKPVNPPASTPAVPQPPKSTPGAPQPPKETPVVPPTVPKPTGGAPPAGNGTVPTYSAPAPPAGSGKPSGTGSAPPSFTGAANAMAASGAGLAAVFGVAAYLL